MPSPASKPRLDPFTRAGEGCEGDSMKDDGGSAFPKFELDSGAGGCVGGMSLRDYFAAKALQALIIGASNNSDSIAIQTREGLLIRPMRVAGTELAYSYADAMLAEREKPPRKLKP